MNKAPQRRLCHASGSELLLFMPRDRADALRLRVMSDPRFSNVHVSALYRAGTGWAVCLCPERHAPLNGPSRVNGEPRTVEFV